MCGRVALFSPPSYFARFLEAALAADSRVLETGIDETLELPCTRPDGTSLWVSGWEDDTYARVDGVWLHASMRLTTVFVSPAGGGWPRILA